MVATEAPDREGPGRVELSRLRDLREEVDREAPHRQGRAVAGVHHCQLRGDARAPPGAHVRRDAARAITKGAVRRWYEDTLEGSGDTPRANSKAYGLLRAIMNSAVDEDLIEASPVHICGAGYQPKRRRLEPATIEEIDVIVENIAGLSTSRRDRLCRRRSRRCGRQHKPTQPSPSLGEFRV